MPEVLMGDIAQWFAEPGRTELASFAVAIAAFLVSVVAVVMSVKTQGKQGKLQARLVEIEEARDQSLAQQARRARLRAEITSRPGVRSPNYYLEIINDGEAVAGNVIARLEDKPIMEHPAIPGFQSEITEIGPRSTARYILSITMTRTPPWRLSLTWDDESGSPGSYQTTLTT